MSGLNSWPEIQWAIDAAAENGGRILWPLWQYENRARIPIAGEDESSEEEMALNPLPRMRVWRGNHLRWGIVRVYAAVRPRRVQGEDRPRQPQQVPERRAGERREAAVPQQVEPRAEQAGLRNEAAERISEIAPWRAGLREEQIRREDTPQQVEVRAKEVAQEDAPPRVREVREEEVDGRVEENGQGDAPLPAAARDLAEHQAEARQVVFGEAYPRVENRGRPPRQQQYRRPVANRFGRQQRRPAVTCRNCHLDVHGGRPCPFDDNRVCGHCDRLAGHISRECPDVA